MRPTIPVPEREQPLAGGNTAQCVVRLGDTVRKPVTPATPAVHSLLRHLRATGFREAPEPLGLDEQHRQVLEYVPGPSWHSSPKHTTADLCRVGSIIRALHDAAATFQPPAEARWNTRYQLPEQDTICHNDLAPWNLICGPDRWVFIDWDAAAPATPLWDLAWSAITFPPFLPAGDLAAAASAMHALLQGYGLPRSSYAKLMKHMETRARAEHNFIVDGAAAGEEPWVRLHGEGHHRYWGPVADLIGQNASTLERALRRLDDLRH